VTAPRARSRTAAGARNAEPKLAKLVIACFSGPNLNLLGRREPDVYGRETLDEIHARLALRGAELGVTVDARQTNHEGVLCDWIGLLPTQAHGLLLNAGAYTHTSIAILDALRATRIPCVEVHLSNPEAREPFRRRSRVAAACLAKVSGFGGDSYVLALEGLVARLRSNAAV
jgi:3-dehydroquinate dehydratase-2